MTKLESVFKAIDTEYEDRGSVDPIAFIKEYLRERNDFVAEKLTAEQAIIARGAANEFDNAEVKEVAVEFNEASGQWVARETEARV